MAKKGKNRLAILTFFRFRRTERLLDSQTQEDGASRRLLGFGYQASPNQPR